MPVIPASGMHLMFYSLPNKEHSLSREAVYKPQVLNVIERKLSTEHEDKTKPLFKPINNVLPPRLFECNWSGLLVRREAGCFFTFDWRSVHFLLELDHYQSFVNPHPPSLYLCKKRSTDTQKEVFGRISFKVVEIEKGYAIDHCTDRPTD